MAYRVDPSEVPAILATLDHREQAGYLRDRANAELDDGRVIEGLLYAAAPGNPSWTGPTPIPELAAHIERSSGPSGSNLSYLLRLDRALSVLGTPDPHVRSLARSLEQPWRPPQVRVPVLSPAQHDALLRRLGEGGITLAARLENGGRGLAVVARDRFLGSAQGARVTVLAGTGGNGAAALVAARRLCSWGARVQVFASRAQLDGLAGQQLQALALAGVPVHTGLPQGAPADVVLDGLLGSGQQGGPRGTVADAIAWANEQQAPVLALDRPSGSIRAWATVALGLPREDAVGEVYLVDLGVPSSVYEALGAPHPCPFGTHDVVQLSG